jgi:hypothetical protein
MGSQEPKYSLSELEALVDAGVTAEKDAGWALLTIQKNKLYKQAGYRSFHVYCNERFGMERAHLYRLMVHAKVRAILSPAGDINERQARELAPLAKAEPAAAVRFWEDLRAAHPEGVTSKEVRDAVAQYCEGQGMLLRPSPSGGAAPRSQGGESLQISHRETNGIMEMVEQVAAQRQSALDEQALDGDIPHAMMSDGPTDGAGFVQRFANDIAALHQDLDVLFDGIEQLNSRDLIDLLERIRELMAQLATVETAVSQRTQAATLSIAREEHDSHASMLPGDGVPAALMHPATDASDTDYFPGEGT